MKQFKTGLVIMRAQPFHIGHESVIRQMLAQCDTAIVLLGSAQESRTAKNPFTVTERKQMIKNVFGNRVLVSGIADLGNINLWAGYVLATVWKKWHLMPDVYYSGTEPDRIRFADAGLKLVDISRQTIPISATQIRANPDVGIRYVNRVNREMVSNFFNNKCY